MPLFDAEHQIVMAPAHCYIWHMTQLDTSNFLPHQNRRTNQRSPCGTNRNRVRFVFWRSALKSFYRMLCAFMLAGWSCLKAAWLNNPREKKKALEGNLRLVVWNADICAQWWWKIGWGESRKQNNFISVAQGIFSGVMPLVYLDCFSWRRAIYSSFRQPVATSLRHGDNELITDGLLFSSSVGEKFPPHLHVRLEPVTFWISLDFPLFFHDIGEERGY